MITKIQITGIIHNAVLLKMIFANYIDCKDLKNGQFELTYATKELAKRAIFECSRQLKLRNKKITFTDTQIIFGEASARIVK